MLLIDLQYFTNIEYYKNLFIDSYIMVEQYENFQKTGFHNRCTILGANGPITLSIPIDGGRTQKGIMKEVRISTSEKWQRGHWRSIVSAYNRSPWFDFYKDSLAVLYETPFTFLVDWNLECLQWSLKCLKADFQLSLTNEYKKIYEGTEAIDFRNKITPKTPGPFLENGNEKPIIYRQVFEDKTGFIPNLSILDLLFCEGGKKANSILKGSKS